MSGDPALREAINARITALEVAQRALKEQPADAAAAVRRIAQALKSSEIARSSPALSERITALLRSRRADTIDRQTTELLEALRAAAALESQPAGKVLLVDDDRLLGAIVKDALSEGGFEVVVAETLRQAGQILDRHRISLAILDLILPDGDGRSLLLKMREDHRTAALPVFVMTGKSGSQAMTECYALGADAFFEKPVKIPALIEAVSERLRNKPSDDSAADPLTGVMTRASLLGAFDQLGENGPAAVTVALVAVDALSEALRNFGGELVESVLRDMAASLANGLPAGSHIGRWSGSEFLCILPGVPEAEAAEMLEDALAGSNAASRITFSAGVAEGTTGESLEDLTAAATSHLATARMLGGGRALWRGAGVEAPTKTVLFVEDDEVIASLVAHRLKRDGFEVTHTADGVSAVQALGERRFSIAILESRTPGLDGFSVLERMRAQPHLRRTPVIMLSSMGNEKDVVRCFELGADDYMLKPFSPVELLARVHRLLARQ